MTQEQARTVLRLYGLGDSSEFGSGSGGTAGAAVRFACEAGEFLLRRRSAEQLDPDQIAYEHRLLEVLKVAALPVALPIPAGDGRTWVSLDGAVYEVYPWIDGDPYQPGNTEQLADLGGSIARFHIASAELPPKPHQQKEDDPARLQRELIEFTLEADREAAPALFEELQSLLENLEWQLTTVRNVDSLPQTVIHGDLHPGNAKFARNDSALVSTPLNQRDSVVGLFDFDWANRRERARDIADGLLFFCRKNREVVDSNDIWALTESGEIDPIQSQVFLRAYESVSLITTAELQALPSIMTARFAQTRIRGMRKVPARDRLRFLDRGDLMVSLGKLLQFEE